MRLAERVDEEVDERAEERALAQLVLHHEVDHAGAKAQVMRMLKEWFGWKDIIDLGDITNARGA